MTNRTKFTVAILTFIVLALIFYVPTRQPSYATPLSSAAVAFGPTQFYAQHNIISDGSIAADHTDTNLVNAWGLVAGPTTPWWISDNGTGKTTLFNVATNAIQAEFTVPGAGGAQGNPTGVVFN